MKEETKLDTLLTFINENFYKPDLQAARIILAAAFSHYLKDHEPIWMFVVGPPSSGKTSITIEALSGLTGMFGDGQTWGKKVSGFDPDNPEASQATGNKNKRRKSNEGVEVMSTFNPNTFLSHMVGVKDPGLLEQIGNSKAVWERNGNRKISTGNVMVLIPDFTVIAQMRSEVRGEIMGQLRRIYDGKFEKKVGTTVTKIWKGKMTLLAATTPVIDKYTSIDSAMGERFIQINWRASTTPGRLAWLLKRNIRKSKGELVSHKKKLKDLTQALFGSITPRLVDLTDKEMDRMSALAELSSIARTSVFGTKYASTDEREVTEVGTAEDIWRIGQQFQGLISTLCNLQGHDTPTKLDFQDLMRTGIETLPVYRSVVLQAAIENRPLKTYFGSRGEKSWAAKQLFALGIIEKAHIGDGPVKLRPYWQDVVDRLEIDPLAVFTESGAAGERERAELTAKQAPGGDEAPEMF